MTLRVQVVRLASLFGAVINVVHAWKERHVQQSEHLSILLVCPEVYCAQEHYPLK